MPEGVIPAVVKLQDSTNTVWRLTGMNGHRFIKGETKQNPGSGPRYGAALNDLVGPRAEREV